MTGRSPARPWPPAPRDYRGDAVSRAGRSRSPSSPYDGEGAVLRAARGGVPDGDRGATGRHADERDPAAVTADGGWWLRFRASRSGSATARSAGRRRASGRPTRRPPTWAPVPGRLPAELAAAGIDPADVDTRRADPPAHRPHRLGGAPAGDAVLPERALSCSGPSRGAVADRGLGRPCAARTRCGPPASSQVVDGDTGWRRGVTGGATPRGTRPGHQSVLVSATATTRLLVTGDLLVHACSWSRPEHGVRPRDGPGPGPHHAARRRAGRPRRVWRCVAPERARSRVRGRCPDGRGARRRPFERA